MTEPHTILLIDDEEDILEVLEEYFKEKGYRVLTAATGEEGIDIARGQKLSMVLVDLRLPGADGTEVVDEIRKIDSDLPVVIITAYPSFETAVKAIRARVYDYLVKPFQISYLGMVVEKAIQEYLLTQRRGKLEDRLAEAKAIVDRVKRKGS